MTRFCLAFAATAALAGASDHDPVVAGLDHVPIVVVGVAVDFEDDGGTIFDSVLGDTLAKTIPS